MGSYLKDKKISIYRFKEGKPGKNGFSTGDTYEKIHEGKLWAYYRQTSGKEYYAAMAAQYQEEAVFIINYRENLEPLTDVILFRHRIYQIVRVDNFEGYKGDIKLFVKWSKRDFSSYPGISDE